MQRSRAMVNLREQANMETITRTCIADCDRAPVAHGMCLKHYKRWRRRGTTHDVTPEERFFSFVQPVTEWDACWIWTNRLAAGYGQFWIGKKIHLAHRWSYEFLRGPIPDGLKLDHLCSRPACVNPWHLEPVTQRENLRRSTNHVGARIRAQKPRRPGDPA